MNTVLSELLEQAEGAHNQNSTHLLRRRGRIWRAPLYAVLPLLPCCSAIKTKPTVGDPMYRRCCFDAEIGEPCVRT